MAERLIFEIRLKGLAFGERGLGSLAGGHSDEKVSLLLHFPALLQRPVFTLLHIPTPMGDFSEESNCRCGENSKRTRIRSET